MVWKRPPYAPPNTAAGFTARDADWLQEVRLQRCPDRDALGRGDARATRRGGPGVLPACGPGDQAAGRPADLDALRRPPGHVARAVRRRGGARVRGEAADAVRADAVREGAVPDGLLDPRGLPGLRRLLGEQGQPPGRLGGGLEAGRPALQEPALLDGLRPAQRALGRQGVAVVPDHRLRAELCQGAPAGDGAGAACGPRRSTARTWSGGSRSSSRAGRSWRPSTSRLRGSATSVSPGTTTARTCSSRARASPAATPRTAGSTPPTARTTRSTRPVG